MRRGIILFALILYIPLLISFQLQAVQAREEEDFNDSSTGTFCWADFDRDGLEDLYIVRKDSPGSLLRNIGNGDFEDVTDWADPSLAQNSKYAVWKDYDKDGYPDLYLVCIGNNLLYKNCDGTEFIEIGEEAGLDNSGNGESARWIDYDQDSYPDLELENQDGNLLFHNEGDGIFEEVLVNISRTIHTRDGGDEGQEMIKRENEDSTSSIDSGDHSCNRRTSKPEIYEKATKKPASSSQSEIYGKDDLLHSTGDCNARGWVKEHHISKPDPDGIVWLDNTSDGIAVRGQSDDGIGVHAWSAGSGLALKAQGTSYFEGNVGIGTMNPLVKLSLGPDINPKKLSLYDATSDFWGFGIDLGRIAFYAKDTEQMSILGTGTVGIGTPLPLAKLHISEPGGTPALWIDSGDTPMIKLNNTGGSKLSKITFLKEDAEHFALGYDLWGTNEDIFTLYDSRSGGYGPVLNIKDGGVGIGTTIPEAKLHVVGDPAGPYDYGVRVDSPHFHGVYIYDTGLDGVHVESPGSDGVHVESPDRNGVRVDYPGQHGVEIWNPGNCGVYVISPGGDGVFVSSSGGSGVSIYESVFDGIHIESPGVDGVHVESPGVNGVDVRAPGNNCYLCNGSPYDSNSLKRFKVTNTCEVYGHSYNQYIVDEEGLGVETPVSASTARWFEHVGEAQLENGTCRVDLPENFTSSVTVDDEYRMQVFLTPYAPMGEYWIERGDGYFAVHQVHGGDPDAEFGYKVCATIRGCEADRLHFVDLKAELEDN